MKNTSPSIPDKSFYTPTVSITILSTEKPLTSSNETPITTKSESRDHHKTQRNSSN